MGPEKKDKTAAKQKRLRIICAISAAAVVLTFFAAMPDFGNPFKEPKQTESFVSIIELPSSESIGFDELFDDSPMFIPTRWNFGMQTTELPMPKNWNLSPSKKMDSSELGLSNSDQSFLIGDTSDIERGKSGLMRSIMRNVFSGYGRSESAPPNVSADGTFNIIDISSGKTVASEKFPSSIARNMLFMAEFAFEIEPDGRIMRPMMRESSGNDDVDKTLADMLNTGGNLRHIAPGTYKALFIP